MRKIAIAAAAVIALASVKPAAAERHFHAGTLTCRLAPTVGLIIGSRQQMECRFVGTRDRRAEYYSGVINRFGLDLGFTSGGVLVWRVLSRTRVAGRGFLSGHFAGASGDVSFGPGVGAKVLIGGSQRTITLQPLSVSGRTGINLAAGVTGLTLTYTGRRHGDAR